MEKNHFYTGVENADNYINPDGWKLGRPQNHLLTVQSLKINGADVRSPVNTQVIKPGLSTDIFKPSILNTGIAGGTKFVNPTPPVAMTKPADANSPLILVPNVPGGLATSTPPPPRDILSVVKAAQIKQATENPPIRTDTTGKLLDASNIIQNNPVATPSGALTAGMSLPNIKIILGMVAAVILFYFLAKKYGK